MKTFFSLITLVGLYFLFTACQKHKTEPIRMSPKQIGATFVVGIEDGYPPYTFKSDTGGIIGYDIDLLTEVAKRNKWNLKLQVIDWGKKDYFLESGKVDVLASGIKMEGREKLYEWTKPYLQCVDVILTMKGKHVRSMSDLKGKRVGIQTSTPIYMQMGNNDSYGLEQGVKLVGASNFGDLVIQFFKGSIDALITNGRVGEFLERKNSNVIQLNTPLLLNRDSFAFKCGNLALRNQVEKALEEMAIDGTMEKITIKWFGKNISLYCKRKV